MSGENIQFVIVYTIFTGIFATVAFMISWLSFPMVLDKNVDTITASIASLRVAITNKFLILTWISIVLILIVVALMVSYFAGLIIVVPILAHSTWHAYKSMVGDIQNISS